MPPLAIMVAHFWHTYPGMFHSPSWKTTDHVIPWKLFYAMYHNINAVQALDRLHVMQATALAIGTAMGGKSVQRDVKKVTDAWTKEALHA